MVRAAPVVAPVASPPPVKRPARRDPVPTVPSGLVYTVQEVASALKVSRATVDRLQARGTLPGKVKVGGQVRYVRQVIDQWLLHESEECQDGNQDEPGRRNQQEQPVHPASL